MSAIKNFLMQNKVTHKFSSCQWPYGDPQEKDFHFCEEKTFETKVSSPDKIDLTLEIYLNPASYLW